MNLISKLAPILRMQQAGKDADEPEVITIRRMRYPNETPEEYLASQNKLDQDYEDSIAQARKELKTKKGTSNKKATGAAPEKIPFSSPEIDPEPAPDGPLAAPEIHPEYTPTPAKPPVETDWNAIMASERQELFNAFNAVSEGKAPFSRFNR